MDSGIECRPEPVARLSRRVAAKVESVSLSDLETLRNSKEFRRVLSSGTRNRVGGITLVRSPGRPGSPRVGFVASKSTGNAVTRNRIKRRLRTAVGVLDLQPETDYVIIASSIVAEVTYDRLQRWLSRALEDSSHV